MTKFVVVASAKGGVGKTTTAINLATALNSLGRDVVVVDGNLSTPNVGLYLGSPRAPVTIHDVLKGKNHILDSVYMHSHGLKVVPGSIAIDAVHEIDHDSLSDVILGLAGTTEIAVIDSAAGLGREARAAINAGDEILIVTTPELASVTDALKTIRYAQQKNKSVVGVLVTRTNGDNLEMTNQSIQALLEVPVIGEIPEDDNVRLSNRIKHPVTFSHPHSPSSVGYKKLASLLLGQKYEESIEAKEETFMDYVFKRLGMK